MSTWTAIVPAKGTDRGKSRMLLPADDRGNVATAFVADLLDTLERSSRIGSIVVATARPELADVTPTSKAFFIEDDGTGLNRAIENARRWAAAHRPTHPVVVVPADLPCLTESVLETTLGLLGAYEAAHVPDRAGSGTTLLAASTPDRLSPAYGPGSSAVHRRNGAKRVVSGVDPRARHDVDTVADLRRAVALGVGPRTHLVLERIHGAQPQSGSVDHLMPVSAAG